MKNSKENASSHNSDDRVDSKGNDLGSDFDQVKLQELLTELGENLEPMAPREGVNRYLRNRTEIADKTRTEYRRKLGFFLEFVNQIELDELNNLSGRDIDEFQTWRRKDSTDEVDVLAATTMQDDLLLLRDFLAYLESIDAVSEDLTAAVRIPEVEDGVRDIELKPERLGQIISYLSKFEYASFDHVIFCLYEETGRRTGAIHGLDLEDYRPNADDPYIEFRHRPGETTLKNGVASEREVYLPSEVNEVLKDYVETSRYDTEDEYGRQPLLTTRCGRPAKSTLRKYIYKWTRPCAINQDCPHGKSPDTCEAAIRTDSASKCDSSRSPHAIRHGHLTQLKRKQVPTEIIRDRCDVSERILEKHYDERTEKEKRSHRREVLEAVRENGGGYV